MLVYPNPNLLVDRQSQLQGLLQGIILQKQSLVLLIIFLHTTALLSVQGTSKISGTKALYKREKTLKHHKTRKTLEKCEELLKKTRQRN